VEEETMTRLHRAVEKAEREGLLTWTQPVATPDASRVAVEEPAAPVPARPDGDLLAAAATFELPSVESELLAPLLVAATAPESAAAEQYRLLKTRIEGREGSRRIQMLLVTSPRIGDGKTTTCANLALTMAQDFQQKVALVEADLRRPSLAEQFGVPAEPGLVDVLMGSVTLDDALTAVPGHQLWLLPAGAASARASELLSSSLIQRVFSGLRGRFHRVLVDTPPVALADTHVLARLADGVLVVVRAGVTPRPSVERALAGVDRERLVGLVLNEVDDSADEYAYAARQYGE
jgi:capsular exopolysaccharide synthesis family protein